MNEGRRARPPAKARRALPGALAGVLGGALPGALLATALALAAAPHGAQAATLELRLDDGSGYAEQRAALRRALDALAEGRPDDVAAERATLEGYPLADWLRYEELGDRWARAAPGPDAEVELERFAARSDDATLERRLARRLQNALVEAGAWERLLDVQASAFGSDMPCASVRARHELGRLDGFDEVAAALWVDPAGQSAVCRDVLADFAEEGPPDIASLWERIYVAIDDNAFDRAREAARWLGSADRRALGAWLDAVDTPAGYLTEAAATGGALAEDTPLNRRTIVDLVLRWARQDTAAAVEWWLANSPRYRFFRDRYYDTHRSLVMRAAQRRLPGGYGWLESLEARSDDLELLEWRVRAALWEGNWLEVVKSLHRLPEQEREEDHWAYWEARALEIAGHEPQARAIYERIAGEQSWHGFLAADRLERDYGLVDEPIDADPATVLALADSAAMVRAREFAAVGLDDESRRIWNAAYADADTTELAASAVLAKAWRLDDRAIFSAGRAQARRALSYRFPVLYRAEVAAAATAHRIEPAWIFGVMRRESAFIPNAVSRAGALGLMQLMPRTADYIAELRDLDDFDGELTGAARNIDFGTFYLGHVLEQFDGHAALATASYNAGPSRVRSWLPERSMEADRWIDTIPFTETRRYVRAVLAYAVIYEHRLTGSAQPISAKLPPIPGTLESASSDES